MPNMFRLQGKEHGCERRENMGRKVMSSQEVRILVLAVSRMTAEYFHDEISGSLFDAQRALMKGDFAKAKEIFEKAKSVVGGAA